MVDDFIGKLNDIKNQMERLGIDFDTKEVLKNRSLLVDQFFFLFIDNQLQINNYLQFN